MLMWVMTPGHLVRIGPTTLLTDDPDIIRHMNNARSKHAKTDWYTFMRLNPYIDNIFSERDLAKHDQLRATMEPAVVAICQGGRIANADHASVVYHKEQCHPRTQDRKKYPDLSPLH